MHSTTAIVRPPPAEPSPVSTRQTNEALWLFIVLLAISVALVLAAFAVLRFRHRRARLGRAMGLSDGSSPGHAAAVAARRGMVDPWLESGRRLTVESPENTDDTVDIDPNDLGPDDIEPRDLPPHGEGPRRA